MDNREKYVAENIGTEEEPIWVVFYPITVASAVHMSGDPENIITVADQIDELQNKQRQLEQNFADGCEQIAAAITSMGVDTAVDASISEIVDHIKRIRTNLTGNALPGMVLEGHTFYSKDPEEKRIGTMPDWSGVQTAASGARLKKGLLELIPAAGYHTADYASCSYVAQTELAKLAGLTGSMLLKGNEILGITGTVDPEAIYQAGYDTGVIDTEKRFCIINCTDQVGRLDLTDTLSLRPYTDSLLVTQPPTQMQQISDKIGRLSVQGNLSIR